MKTNTSFYFLLFLCVTISFSLVFSMYMNKETFETQSSDVNKLTTLKKEIKLLNDKVEANAQQTQDDRKYIEKAVERVIEKLNNS
jgi:hypothetical protein